MLLPQASDRTVEILSGAEAISSFGLTYQSPDDSMPEANASRTMISPIQANKNDRFLTVFQVVDGETLPFPVKHMTTHVSDVVVFDQHVVSRPKGNALINKSFEIEVPKGKKTYHIIINGVEEGDWNVKGPAKQKFNVQVLKGKNTIYFMAKAGNYKISTGAN